MKKHKYRNAFFYKSLFIETAIHTTPGSQVHLIRLKCPVNVNLILIYCICLVRYGRSVTFNRLFFIENSNNKQ